MDDAESRARWIDYGVDSNSSDHLAGLFDCAYRDGTFGDKLQYLPLRHLKWLSAHLERFIDYEEGPALISIARALFSKLFKQSTESEQMKDDCLSILGDELNQAIHVYETAQEKVSEYLKSFIDTVLALGAGKLPNNLNSWTLNHLIDADQAQLKPQQNRGIISISVNESLENNLAFVKNHIVTAMHMANLGRGK